MGTLKRFSWALAVIAALLPVLCRAQNYSDIWWNPNESGWGVTIADHQTQLFAVWYAYDVDGSPMWFTVPGGTFSPDRLRFTGDLYRTTGPSFTGPFDPTTVTTTKVGSASFDFSNVAAGSASFTWTVGSVTRTEQIKRMPYGSAAPNWSVDSTDIWWNAAESGWGLSLVQHGNNIFGAWFTYAPGGHPLFIVMPGVQPTSASDTFTGTLYTTTGPAYNAPNFDPTQVKVSQVGSATLRLNGDSATFTATVSGMTQTKTLTRQPFGGGPVVSQPTQADANRVEENNPSVTFAGAWTKSDASWGWSGGSAMESGAAGATATISFSGTSIRWIGARGRRMGIANVSVDGGPPRTVNLFAHPTDEIHTPIVTIYDLSPGQHTLTITVTGGRDNQALGNAVVVDAFDINPTTTVSHWQDTNPDLKFSSGWTKSSNAFNWSGSGVSNLPELPVTAQETQTAGETMTLPFRGTGIRWIGYLGPDAGIANVSIDGGAPTQVDMYSPTAKYQPIVFSALGLADTNHTIVITATGRVNAASSGARVVVDAFDILTPGRRYEEYEKSISYVGTWTPDNQARVWSEGETATSNVPGSTATFSFNGSSVSWIGCEKDSASGVAEVYIDGVFQTTVRLNQNYPIEGYQMTVFRKDGLALGPHTLTVKVINTDGSYVVVDAFDVR